MVRFRMATAPFARKEFTVRSAESTERRQQAPLASAKNSNTRPCDETLSDESPEESARNYRESLGNVKAGGASARVLRAGGGFLARGPAQEMSRAMEERYDMS